MLTFRDAYEKHGTNFLKLFGKDVSLEKKKRLVKKWTGTRGEYYIRKMVATLVRDKSLDVANTFAGHLTFLLYLENETKYFKNQNMKLTFTEKVFIATIQTFDTIDEVEEEEKTYYIY